MNKKILVFEGAGWAEADSSKATDVGNCRIRTRLRNNISRVIYLEIIRSAMNIPNNAHVDFCFYDDSEWDINLNHSSDFKPLTYNFTYSKHDILEFVNNTLNCSFKDMTTINDGSVRVHDTKEPICDCAKDGYVPYKDNKINISILEGIEQLHPVKNKPLNFGKYKLEYRFIKKHFKDHILTMGPTEQNKLKSATFYIMLRWNKDGFITSADISVIGGGFPCFGCGLDITQKAVDEILNLNESNKKG